MGQRFQAHYILKTEDRKDHDTGRKIKGGTVKKAYHLQWSWGMFSLIRLEQVLSFANNYCKYKYNTFNKSSADNEYGLIEAGKILQALTSLNMTNGSYVEAIEEPSITEDPTRGDNNDGIFIVDLRGENPKYCFMHWYRNNDDDYRYKPLTAEGYLRIYKYTGLPNNQYDDEDIKLAKNIIKKINNFDLLTEEEVEEAYPSMFE